MGLAPALQRLDPVRRPRTARHEPGRHRPARHRLRAAGPAAVALADRRRAPASAWPATSGAWSIDRIYSTFPRLAERKGNGGAQLSGGEQQMLAIGRALLLNPKLLVMDEPTEGLAPVIVTQVEEMLLRLGQEGEIDVLVIEQNIGVATSVAETVAIMVNGRINRVADAAQLAGDRELQQRLLGVGRHAHDETPEPADGRRARRRTGARGRAEEDLPLQPRPADALVAARAGPPDRAIRPHGVGRRRTRPVSAELRPLARRGRAKASCSSPARSTPRAANCAICATCSRRRACRRASSTCRPPAPIRAPTSRPIRSPPSTRAARAACSPSDRGESVAGMTLAFERWITRQRGIGGIIGAGGSGGTAMLAPAMRALPFGVPKLIVSTVASSDVRRYRRPIRHRDDAFGGRHPGAEHHHPHRCSTTARMRSPAWCAAGEAAASGPEAASRPALPAARHHHVRRDHALRAAARRRRSRPNTNASCSTPPASAASRWRG